MSTATPRTGRESSVPEVPRTDHVDAVRLTDLHKSFGDVTAVDGVDLTISPGEVVALLGPNGAGKTTTIDMILGLSRPTSGDARVFGMTPRQAVDRGLVAAVMQTAGLLPDITVRETVELTASLFSHRTDAEEAMRRAGVTDFASRIVKKCSGGQQQRVLVARCVAARPRLILLDEPFNGLDQPNRDALLDIVATLKSQGTAIVVSTHDLVLAKVACEQVALLAGRQIAFGPREEVLVPELVSQAYGGWGDDSLVRLSLGGGEGA